MALARPKEKWNNQTAFLLVFILSILIGLRFRVGDDWSNYIINLKKLNM